MPLTKVYLFADEAGNFDFSKGQSASRFFILGSVVLDDLEVGDRLMQLRRNLAWDGRGLDSCFHATTDKQDTRDAVFNVLRPASFRVDATILEKSKAAPRIASDEERFYKTAWYQHLKFLAPRITSAGDELLVVAASWGTKKRASLIRVAIENVVRQSALHLQGWQVAFWRDESDPCLQLADYCTWAIQRKWETNDDRSHRLIADKIRTEFDLFRLGTRHYY